MKKPIKTRLISGITAFSLILTSMFVPLTSYGENEVPDTSISTEASASVGEDGTEGIPGVSGVSGEESTAAGVTGSTAETVGDGSDGSTFVEGTTEAAPDQTANDGVEGDTELSTEDTQETGTEAEKASEEGTTSETGTEETTGTDLFDGARKAFEDAETVDYRNLSFKLYPDDDDKDKTVTLTGFMPKDAEASAAEVTDEHVDDAELIDAAEEKEAGAKTGTKAKVSADAKTTANTGVTEADKAPADKTDKTPAINVETETVVIAAYDITIMDGDEAYQPGEEHPVSVKIIDSRISASADISIWHIHDDGTREEIKDFTLGEGKVTFDATGFSVYEIVEKNMTAPVGTGWQKIQSVEELIQNGSDGIVIGHTDGFYFKNKEYTATGSRKGIEKTKPAQSMPSIDNIKYYFELVDGSSNEFTVYCIINKNKYYIHHENNGSDGDVSKSLTLTNNEADKTIFTIEKVENSETFTVLHDKYYWNQQGDSNGKGFAAYKENNKGSRIQFWYYIPVAYDPYDLNGKTYGLLNHESGSAGYALMADETKNAVELPKTTIREDTTRKMVYVSEDIDITMWTFECDSEDNYFLYASDKNKYLKRTDEGLVFVDAKTDATAFKVVPDGNGKFELKEGGKTVYYDAGEKKYSVSDSPAQGTTKLRFVEFSEVSKDNDITYSANKVSISDVPDGAQVIVYTRIWDDTNKVYNFYAIDKDGTLQPCYERGDNIMWLGDKVNTLLWDFTEYKNDDGTLNYYYELQNVYSGKYLAPQIKSNQALSDSKIGINLPGRKLGEFYSKILAWDELNYSFAGIKPNDTNDAIVSCPRTKSVDFYFATMEPLPAKLTEVETIDNDEFGITMKMVDFSTRADMNTALGDNTDWKDHKYVPKTNILANQLQPNTQYPLVTANETSLSTMFQNATKVNHLFIESTYLSSGYFEFDSCQNFATLVKNGTVGTDFTVYKELGTTDESDTKNSLKHGQFYPYNWIIPGQYSEKNPENLYTALANNDDATVGRLDDNDPRKYEKLHKIQGNGDLANYYNGMELTARFAQTASGKDAWGHDIIFEFTGDDDFWLYVDGELVIDLGGIHSALPGNVNFSTGVVSVNGHQSTLREVFENNYRARNANPTQAEVDAFLAQYFDGAETIFKDYSQHTMRIFYMERGAGASNLHMRFNLSYVRPGSVVLSKKVTEGDDRHDTTRLDYSLAEYPFQIFYTDEGTGKEIQLKNEGDSVVNVTYQNSTQTVDYVDSYTPPGCTKSYEGVYFLSPGMNAEVHFQADTIQYRVVECGINSEVYDRVYVNDRLIENTEGDPDRIKAIEEGSTRVKVDPGNYLVKENPSMVFENHIDPDGLRTIQIKKNLVDENGDPLTEADDGTTFSYRLSLSNGNEDTLYPANMVAYNVRSPEGFLCRWDSDNQRFAPTSNTSLNDMATEEELATVTFETSMNGAISRIPAGYTVEVINIPAGTKFEVEERADEIPLGYKLVKYERIGGTYSLEPGSDENIGWINDTDSPVVHVNNQRGWEIRANKVWSDAKYVEKRDPIYFAVYINNVLMPGSVRKVAYPNTSTRYFFDSLGSGVTFDDYKIYEVKLTNPVENTDGSITYSSLERVDNGGNAVVNTKVKTRSDWTNLSYRVDYETGTATASSGKAGQEANIRTDTVTNTRSGGIRISLYKMGTDPKVPLAGGEFTLQKLVGTEYVDEGTYTSDANGRITILYEFEEGVDYILTETKSPKNHIGLEKPIKFKIITDAEEKKHVELDLNDQDKKWADYEIPTGDADKLVAYINVYNRPYTLEVYKFDGEKTSADGSLAEAHFALYRGVQGFGGYVKDYQPIEGYEDLETDSTGRIESIDNEMVEGRYFLVEKTPPEGYIGLDGDVVFDITALGGIKLISSPPGSGVSLETDSTHEIYKYFLNIPNRKPGNTLTVTKTVTGNQGSRDKEFNFTFAVTGDDGTGTTEYAWTKNGISQATPLKSGGTFKLAHNERVAISVPGGAEVTITENAEDYKPTFQLGSATAVEDNKLKFTVSADITLAVTNTRAGIIPTGVWMNCDALLVMALMLGAGIVFFTRRGRKRRRTDEED